MRRLTDLKRITNPTIQDLIEYYTHYRTQASGGYYGNEKNFKMYNHTLKTLLLIQNLKISPHLKVKEAGTLGALDLISPRTGEVLGVWWIPSHSLKMYGKMGSRDIVYKNLEPEKLIYFIRKAYKIEVNLKLEKKFR